MLCSRRARGSACDELRYADACAQEICSIYGPVCGCVPWTSQQGFTHKADASYRHCEVREKPGPAWPAAMSIPAKLSFTSTNVGVTLLECPATWSSWAGIFSHEFDSG